MTHGTIHCVCLEPRQKLRTDEGRLLKHIVVTDGKHAIPVMFGLIGSNIR
jgi:hypothetical protein